MLEEIQKESDKNAKIAKKETIINEIKKDIPAIFLFAPKMSYLKAANVKNVNLKKVATPNERFINIENWFIETNKVWKIFAKT